MKLQDLSDQGIFNDIEVKLEETTESKQTLTLMDLFCNIKVSVIPNTMTIKTKKVKVAQLKTKRSFPNNLNVVNRYNIEAGTYMGCCTLLNGRFIVVYVNNCAQLLDKNGSLVSTVDLIGAYDVTLVDDIRIALSNYQSGTISMVDLSSSEITKTINTRSKHREITCKDGNIIFCTPKIGLSKLSIDREKEDVIVGDNAVSGDSHVVAGNNCVCYSCPRTRTVNVLDSKYKLLFKLKDEQLLRRPVGVALDDHITFYLVGKGSRNVLAISSDGKTKKELLSKGDGLNEPFAIHFDQYSKQLILVEWSGIVIRYSIQYDGCGTLNFSSI